MTKVFELRKCPNCGRMALMKPRTKVYTRVNPAPGALLDSFGIDVWVMQCCGFEMPSFESLESSDPGLTPANN